MAIKISGSTIIDDSRNIVAGVAATFTGNVTVGGTITYEDVTNIDSVGIVTARTDIHVGENIAHIGDTDTKIVFTDNQIDFQTGGYSRLYTNNSGTFVRSGTNLAFLAASGPSPTIKSGGTNNQDLLLTTGTDNPTRIHIKSDGKVGIGTDTPTNELEVSGSGTVALFKGTGGNAFIGIQDVDSGNNAYIGNEDGGLVFQTPSSSYSTKMTITHSGDVGIGITNPSNTLVLKETDPVLEFRRNFGSGTSDIGSINFGNNNIDSDLARITVEGDGATDNAAIVFKTQATGAAVSEKLRITSAGKVGIGITNPDGLLTIKGDSDATTTPSIRLLDGSDAREVSITNTSGDFVASVHGTDNTAHGHIKMFESGQFSVATGGASGSNTE